MFDTFVRYFQKSLRHPLNYIDQINKIYLIHDYAPVDVDGVNTTRAELGDLTVFVHPVLLVHELAPGVGGKASPITNVDKVSSEALELKLSLTFLVGVNPSLT